MSVIKLHLDAGEYDAVDRFARQLNVTPETVVYAALNRLMLAAREPAVRQEIVETRDWRHDNLPLWSDSALSCHAYEGKRDDEPAPSRYMEP